MSPVEGLPAPRPDVEAATIEPRPAALPALCPYLGTLDGNWRSASAIREHRCLAVSPPVQLAAEKQRRLCLVDRHVDCATYGAAVAGNPQRTRPAPHSRPIARMTPVILDRGRFDLRLPAIRADRPSGQAALVAVLALAFVAILLARPSGDAGAIVAPGSSAAASSAAGGAPTEVAAAPSVAASSTPAATDPPAETEGPSEAPSAGPNSAAPSASPAAEPSTSGATYKVKSGDTLSAIAARFGTTTRVLVRLNGITDPGRLRIGQILKLP